MASEKTLRFAGGALFFLVLGVYLFTLHPTVSPYRDSGDLIVASSTLGVAHPPGYPAYVLLGKAATLLLPWGNIAYRINVMSAVFGALALFLLALSFRYVFKNPLLIVASLFFLAFSPSYWRLSQVSEMYSLNAFFTAGIVLAASRLCVSSVGSHNVVYFLSFLCGLGSGNHQTVIFVIPGLAWLLWRSGHLTFSVLRQAALFFALGVSVYLFLPLRSLTGPLSNWGDPHTFHNLWRVITRSDYGGMRLHPEESQFHWTAAGIFSHLGVYGRSLLDQFTAAGVILAGIGVYVKRKERFFQALFISLLIAGPAFVIFSNLPPSEKTTLPILEPHLVMPNVLLALFIAAGAETLLSLPLGRVLLGAAVLVPFFAHRSMCTYRDHFFAYDYGKNILATMEKGAIVYDPDDPTTFITSYLQTVEKKRQDVRVAVYFRTRWGYESLKKHYPEILPGREIFSGEELARTILDHNRARYPLYAELPVKFPQGYESYPRGLMYRLSAAGEFDPRDAAFHLYRNHNELLQDGQNDFFTNQIISYYAASRSNLGLAFAKKGEREEAKQQYFLALSIDPALAPAYNNLGTLEYMNGDFAAAEKWFTRVLLLDGKNPSIYYNLGLALKAQNKLPEAQELFRKAWNEHRSPDAGNELGLMALNSGNAAASITIFTSIIQSYPDYLTAYYNLGLAYRHTANYAESRLCFETYVARTPDPRDRQEVQSILRELPTRKH